MSLSPPSPPPPPPSPEFHFPVIAIALIGITATGILLITYYIFVIKCCLHLHRVDVLHRLFSRRRHLDAVASPATSPTSSPGLDDAVIRSIPVIKFRKSSVNRLKFAGDGDGDTDNQTGIECAVCLCEFEEGEKLRIIPNCCHGFHIDCIDIWLQNSANCPLCRSAVSASSMMNSTEVIKKYCNGDSSSSSSHNNFSGDDNDDDDDYVVIEIQGNNLDEPRLINRTNSREEEHQEEIRGMKKKFGHVYSMGDELIDSMRKKDEEFQVQPIRRSISMDMSNNADFCIDCRNSGNNMQVSEVISSSGNNSNSSSSKVRRSMFSFGYGRSSRGSVQPIQLDLDP